MQSYHFQKIVERDGSIFISGLPPRKEVEVVVLMQKEPPMEMQDWLDDIRQRHPFVKMTKEEILKTLRKTRETVWAERHAS